MRKLIIIGGVTVAIIAIAAVSMRFYTKTFSPTGIAHYQQSGLDIKVDYCRPYKHDRKVFGKLVPYDEVWRTGANEATVFTTNQSLNIEGKILQPGSYSLFTIPHKDRWDVIFNSEIGQWGIKPFSGKANRAAANDVLTVEVPAITTQDLFEQFTISLEQMSEEIHMVLMWEKTLVVVPITAMEKV
ncbi:DUF2911 domain-containing protein [Fulvivirga sp. M361]|uniref:DUF2911 domain-containing protein n=1 Tax=Fulvivirga sp. M361 TaxID=2594266 RepID=UPI00117AAC92|nr:DUF2911 domain-containing protein [Fulvivirga sp. M361]TRX62727.1 DUF2911 domain-containing protein [Fulvivirga sp. M361]